MSRRGDTPPTFFVDRSLGAHDVPEALRKAGALVEVHDAHFATDTLDADWLPAVGARGWVVLTKDTRIRRNPLELEALFGAQVAAFILTARDMTGADMARVLVGALPRMTSLVRTRARPFIATLSGSGHATIIRGGARRAGVRKP